MEVVTIDMSDPEMAKLVQALRDESDKLDWCECENIDENPKYYDDNSHRGCERKHHWHCSVCGKVSQVG